MPTDSSGSQPCSEDTLSTDDLFQGRLVHWRDRATWFSPLESWLEPLWAPSGKDSLRACRPLDLCWDDCEWLEVLERSLTADIETVQEALADRLELAVLRAFHGCRVLDAGVFHRDGLKINDPARLEADVRKMVSEEEDLAWLRPTIDQRLAEFEHRERDTGRLYVCADDGPQLEHIGHYLLYGSEWVQVLLGWSGHRVLRRRGSPTMVTIDLPLRLATPGTRRAFAATLLQEWTRVFVNGPTFVPNLDFTVILDQDLPASMVVDHYHPTVVKDTFHGYHPEPTLNPRCPGCED
jgi:hypothetical protein